MPARRTNRLLLPLLVARVAAPECSTRQFFTDVVVNGQSVKSDPSGQFQLVRLPKSQDGLDFCKGTTCFAVCAEWMRDLWERVDRDISPRSGKFCAPTLPNMLTKHSSNSRGHEDDKPYSRHDSLKHLPWPSEFQCMPRTLARLHYRERDGGGLTKIDLRAVDVRGYPMNAGERHCIPHDA